MSEASTDALIDGLASELQPVRPRRTKRGMLFVTLGWLAGAAGLLMLLGVREDLAEGHIPPLSMLAFWLVVALAVAASWSAIRMGMPGVGRDYSGWQWAGFALLSVPLTAIFLGLGDHDAVMDAAHAQSGLPCTFQGLVAGLGVGMALFLWLKGGAPTSPPRAGWVIGLAAGASGATILALHCPVNGMIHIALWHGLAILLSGVAGRVLLARHLRW